MPFSSFFLHLFFLGEATTTTTTRRRRRCRWV